jgi:Family of unknown function (DUF6789)
MRNDDKLRQKDMGGESEIIHDIGKGIVAAAVATAAAAAILAGKNVLGILPDFDVMGMLTAFAGSTWPGMGWVVFFVGGGIVLGVIFALLDAHVEATTGAGEVVRGVFFGFLLWLIVMLIFMPVLGAGAFGMRFGVGAPIVCLAADLVYGLVLGAVYGAMHPETVMT